MDTNVIKHTIDFSDKELLVGLHRLNHEFYSRGKIFLLPQVKLELDESLIGSIFPDYLSSFIGLYEYYILNDTIQFHNNIIMDITSTILTPGFLEHENSELYILDALAYLQIMYNDFPDFKNVISFIKYFYSNLTNVDLSQIKSYPNPGVPLANIIEGTKFGDIIYKGFTYRDIYRSVGNFVFDYKNYQNKSLNQKAKVGKDALLISELVFWMNSIEFTKVSNNIIFVTSDYSFFKEINKFRNDCLQGGILNTVGYTGLSEFYLTKLKSTLMNLRVVKLDPINLLYELDGKKSQYVLDLFDI